MFDRGISLFFLLASLLMLTVLFPENPVNPAGTGVQPIEIEPERSR